MYLTSRLRINDLIKRKADYEKQRRQLDNQINDLKTYATAIADGGISIAELMKMPSSMYNRTLTFMNASMQYCQNSSMFQMSQLASQPYYQNQMTQQTPDVQQSYRNMMQMSFYNQAKGQFAKYEESLLHEKEKALQQERDDLNSNLELCKAELDNVRQESKEGLQDIFGGKA